MSQSDNAKSDKDLTVEETPQTESTKQATDMGETATKESVATQPSKEVAGFQAALQRARESEEAAKKSKEDLEKRLREIELAQMSKEDRLQEELLENKRRVQEYEEREKAMDEARQLEDVRNGIIGSYEPEVQAAAREMLNHNPYAVYGDEDTMRSTMDALKKSVKKASGEGLWVDSNEAEPVPGLNLKNTEAVTKQLNSLPLEEKWKKLQEIDRIMKANG